MAKEKGPARTTKQGNAKQIAELAQMSRLAADLKAGTLPDDYAKTILAEAEAQLGMRCAGCGRRITTGFEFMQLSPTVVEGVPTIDRAALSACNGGPDGDCDFAEKARKHATVVKMIEFAWLSPDPRPEGTSKGESSPEAAGNGSNPASPSDGESGATPKPASDTEAASASGEESSSVELPPERRTRE